MRITCFKRNFKIIQRRWTKMKLLVLGSCQYRQHIWECIRCVFNLIEKSPFGIYVCKQECAKNLCPKLIQDNGSNNWGRLYNRFRDQKLYKICLLRKQVIFSTVTFKRLAWMSFSTVFFPSLFIKFFESPICHNAHLNLTILWQEFHPTHNYPRFHFRNRWVFPCEAQTCHFIIIPPIRGFNGTSLPAGAKTPVLVNVTPCEMS